MPSMKYRVAICAIATAVGVISAAAAQDIPPLIPQPREIRAVGTEAVPAEAAENIDIRFDAPESWDDEQYSLRIADDKITVRARSTRGAVWARRTIEQLQRPDGSYPAVEIDDYPEFPLRVFMYDTGRNFVDTDVLKHYIDMISAYKLNAFHWHLTDKPAWRIECRCWPQLNDPKYQRSGRRTGEFYTYDQIRDVIEYARLRGVMIIPEIDIPGHSDYFDAAFGFAMDSAEGMKVLEDCFREFFAEIPVSSCPYLHIGSDEVHIADPEGFMRWAQQTARSDGRTLIAWDPGLPVDSLTVRQIWNDGGSRTEDDGNRTPFVDTSMGYLNYFDPLLFPSRVFFHTPCFTGRRSSQALGGILCMWNDVRVGDQNRIHIQNGMMAGVMPFAERFWNGGIIGEGNMTMQTADSESLSRYKEFQHKMAHHKAHRLAEDMEGWQPIRPAEWEVTLISGSDTLRTGVRGEAVDLEELCRHHDFVHLPTECRAVGIFESECDTTIAVRIGFDSPARSNRLSDGIAEQGMWENSGRVAVNGEPVAPPVWQEPDSYRFHFNTWAQPEEELPYTDEQLYWLREPVKVRLRKGCNKVEMRVLRTFAGQRFHMAFVPVR